MPLGSMAVVVDSLLMASAALVRSREVFVGRTGGLRVNDSDLSELVPTKQHHASRSRLGNYRKQTQPGRPHWEPVRQSYIVCS